MEGSSNDKLYDIQNRCAHPVLLAEWELVSCGNGCSNWEHTASLGTQILRPGDVWRIVHRRASPSLLEAANQTHAYLSNGNDVYAIRSTVSGIVSDSVGERMERAPTRGWAVAGVEAATKDHTLVRKLEVRSGTCGTHAGWEASAGVDAATSEWRVYPRGSIPAPGGRAVVPTAPTSQDGRGASGSGGVGGDGGGGGGGGGTEECPALADCPEPEPAAPSRAADRRLDPSRLVIGTFNAEWLFDGLCDPRISPWVAGGCAGQSNGLNRCDAAGATAHLQRVAEVVGRINVDVLHMAEVEGCAVLSDVIAALGAEGHEYERHVRAGTDTFTRQQVGLISRLTPLRPLERSDAREAYPIDNASSCGATAPGSSGLSKHYLAHLPLHGLPSVAAPSDGSGLGGGGDATLIVLGLHLKAIPTQPLSCQKREAQAKVAQALLTRALEESPYVVALGDLNDFDGDACCRDASGSMPTSRVLRMLKDPRATGHEELRSVAEEIRRVERYTDWWDHMPRDGADNGLAEHSSLDHMLVSLPLYAALRHVTIDHAHQPMDVSDHWPLIATFEFGPNRTERVGRTSSPSPLGAPRPPSTRHVDSATAAAGVCAELSQVAALDRSSLALSFLAGFALALLLVALACAWRAHRRRSNLRYPLLAVNAARSTSPAATSLATSGSELTTSATKTSTASDS